MSTPFADRIDAARQLAAELRRFATQHPLVVAIPRGAVPMAEVIAEELHGDLDVVLVRKLGAPGNRELAVGAVDESGWAYVAPHAADAGADAAYLEGERRRQVEILRERRWLYTPGRGALDPAGRVTIVVDDGLATGATMVAALHALAARAPSRLVCAVPVASRDALGRVAPYADEVVCLHAPARFGAVGWFYDDFREVHDAEVAAILRARERVALEGHGA